MAKIRYFLKVFSNLFQIANLFDKMYSNIKNEENNGVAETLSKKQLEDCEKSISNLVKKSKKLNFQSSEYITKVEKIAPDQSELDLLKLDVKSNLFGAKLEKLESMSPTNSRKFISEIKKKGKMSAFSLEKPPLDDNDKKYKLSEDSSLSQNSKKSKDKQKGEEEDISLSMCMSVENEGIPMRPTTQNMKPKKNENLEKLKIDENGIK